MRPYPSSLFILLSNMYCNPTLHPQITLDEADKNSYNNFRAAQYATVAQRQSISLVMRRSPVVRKVSNRSPPKSQYAGIAQLVEQLIRNQQASGSSPLTSSKNAPCLTRSIFVLQNQRIMIPYL